MVKANRLENIATYKLVSRLGTGCPAISKKFRCGDPSTTTAVSFSSRKQGSPVSPDIWRKGHLYCHGKVGGTDPTCIKPVIYKVAERREVGLREGFSAPPRPC
eukprot:3183924-Pleurochrysis_carterae.AAC.1